MNSDEISAKLKEAISAHSDIIAVYLYGSYASGTARSHSDIDVAVLFSAAVPDTLKDEIRLEGVLDQLPGRRDARDCRVRDDAHLVGLGALAGDVQPRVFCASEGALHQ